MTADRSPKFSTMTSAVSHHMGRERQVSVLPTDGDEMHDGVDAVEGAMHRVCIAHVALHQLHVIAQVHRRHAVAVHLRDQRVERPHAVSAREQGVGEMRADEARPAGD